MELRNLPRERGSHQLGQGSQKELGNQMGQGSRRMGRLDGQPSRRELGSRPTGLGSQQMEEEEELDEQLSQRELGNQKERGSHQMGQGSQQMAEEGELDEGGELQKEEELQLGQQHPKEQGQRVGQKARHRTTVQISCPSQHPHISCALARSCPYQWEEDRQIHLCRWGRGRNAFRKSPLVHRLRLEPHPQGNYL